MAPASEDMIKGRPSVAILYGFTSANADTWCNLAYALLTIAGADGTVSDREMRWLVDHFGGTIGVDGELLRKIKAFDYRHGDLRKILPKIVTDIPIRYSRAILYDAIRMSRADGDYAEEERNAVQAASRLLNVNTSITSAIEEVVEMEDRARSFRIAVFRRHQPVSTPPSEDLETVQLTPYYDSIYGYSDIEYEHLLAYGKILISIAGADGEVSDDERGWLLDHYAPAMNVPQSITTEWRRIIEDRTFLAIQFAEQFAALQEPAATAPQILYDAIKMSSADGYAVDERYAVIQAGKLLGLDDETLNAIENLVKSEHRIDTMRRAIFRVI